MAVSFGQGVSLIPGPTGGGSTTVPWPTTANAAGLINGAYAQYPTGATVLATRTNPTFNYSNTTTATPFDVIAIPANSVAPSGYAEFEIKWSMTSSASAKTLQVVLGHTNFGWTDTQTTALSSTIKFTVQNRGNTSAQIMGSTASGAGGSAIAFDTFTVDFTQEQRFTIWGSMAGTSDTIKVESFTVTVYNPPVYAVNRLEYGTKLFWGANSHWDDSQTIAFHIAGLKTMGMTLVRLAWEGPGTLPTLINWANALAADGTGIQMMVCLDVEIQSGGVIFPDEQTAYNVTFANCQPVVQALYPLGVTLFECGNEADTKDGINIGDQSGGLPTDFSNALVPLFRGMQRGAIDAVHSVPGALAGSNAYTICSIGLSDMMYNGTQPDGTSGHPLVRWDWTSWHNYEDYGPLTAVEMGNNRPWVNIYEYLNRRYKVPTIISEWNGKQSDTDPQRSSWASRHMFEAYNNRNRWNIAAIIVYELYGSPWQVLDGSTNTPISTFGTTVQSFITANPDDIQYIFLMSGGMLLTMAGGILIQA
jgi:hypothetical protein